MTDKPNAPSEAKLKPGEILGIAPSIARDLAERQIPPTFQDELRTLRIACRAPSEASSPAPGMDSTTSMHPLSSEQRLSSKKDLLAWADEAQALIDDGEVPEDQLPKANATVAALRAAAQASTDDLSAEIGMLREKLSDALACGLPHLSDCAVYQAPACEPGPCNCGVGIAADDSALDLVRKIREHNGWSRIATDADTVSLVKAFVASQVSSTDRGGA